MKGLFKKVNATSFFFILAGVVLIVLSVCFAKERIIYTDTAAYLYEMTKGCGFYIATNRFVSIFSQILPAAGMLLALPLKYIIILYSLNFIFIPIAGMWLCYKRFKSRETALAILFFYILMARWLFYYPVSEFEMGLCFLFVYHAFLLHFLSNEKAKTLLFYVVSTFFVPIIIFSHPLSFYVFFAWLIWLLIDEYPKRKILLWFPVVIAFASRFVRDTFFKSMVGNLDYDTNRKSGLEHFHQPVARFFTSKLAEGFYKELFGQYFVLLIIFIVVLLFLIWKRKWLRAAYLAGIVFAFWLLVTVTFEGFVYNNYTEHLYQAIPFFISLAFGKYFFKGLKRPLVQFFSLSFICVILFSKIVSNHQFFTERLQWYQNYIELMHRLHIKKGALSPKYILLGSQDDYWASKAESIILSSLPTPDSSVYLLINWNPETMNEGLSGLPKLNPHYFHLDRSQRFIILDSVANQEELNRLKWAPGGK